RLRLLRRRQVVREIVHTLGPGTRRTLEWGDPARRPRETAETAGATRRPRHARPARGLHTCGGGRARRARRGHLLPLHGSALAEGDPPGRLLARDDGRARDGLHALPR